MLGICTRLPRRMSFGGRLKLECFLPFSACVMAGRQIFSPASLLPEPCR
jgi:hypothetical protein